MQILWRGQIGKYEFPTHFLEEQSWSNWVGVFQCDQGHFPLQGIHPLPKLMRRNANLNHHQNVIPGLPDPMTIFLMHLENIKLCVCLCILNTTEFFWIQKIFPCLVPNFVVLATSKNNQHACQPKIPNNCHRCGNAPWWGWPRLLEWGQSWEMSTHTCAPMSLF